MPDRSKEHCAQDRRLWWVLTGGAGILFLAWWILGGYRWEGYPCYVWNAGMGSRLAFFYAMFGLVIYFSYLLIRVVWVPDRFDNINIALALAGFLILRVLISSAMPLLGDEAYHWLWAPNLDWCYYDHGGMLGV